MPRFHITWGTGPGVVEPFERACREAQVAGRLTILGRHKVTGLVVTDGAVTGVRGCRLADDGAERAVASSRDVVGDFEIAAGAVVVASGGVGANLDLIRQYWPERLGAMPRDVVVGVPAFVDGSMLPISEEAGARIVNRDRMWHYTEGIANHSPVWPGHGIRILPGPSSIWLDADGNRLPAPCFPGFDTLGTLSHLRGTGADHSWFVLTRKVIEKEFALSGSEQNPDLTARSVPQVLGRVRKGAPGPVQRFLDDGEDFLQARSVAELVASMNALVGSAGSTPTPCSGSSRPGIVNWSTTSARMRRSPRSVRRVATGATVSSERWPRTASSIPPMGP